MSGAEWIARCNAEQIGKKVRAIAPGDDFTGTITSGLLETGQWIVTAAGGPDNAFSRYGVDLDEYTTALIDAMQVGGASQAEIAEAVLGVQVDAALPDDGPWQVYRVQGPDTD